MARTSKTAQAAASADVVELTPGIEEQPPVPQSPEPAPDVAGDQPGDAEEAAASPSRHRGPALNRAELIGRIAKEPDVRVTPSGMHVAYFRVATNGRDSTEFHQVTAFGQTAEFIGQYLGVGRLVHLEGRLQTRSYNDPDGIRRWVTTIVVNRLQALDQRRPTEQ